MVNRKLFSTIESFSDFNKSKIGNMGGMRLAAKWDPQKRNANRLKNSGWKSLWLNFWNPKIEDIKVGKLYSIIPNIEIIDAENK